jgi:hypothetical protein
VKIITPPPGTRAFDVFGPVTASQAKAMADDGFRAVGLYAAVVSADTLAACLGAGLGVWWILEGLGGLTVPSAGLGVKQAWGGIVRVRTLGSIAGATVSSDLEGTQGTPDAWKAYADAAASATSQLGDLPATYIGGGIGMTSAELFALAAIRYWKGASKVLDRYGAHAEPACGWGPVQGMPVDWKHPCGLEVDLDCLWPDYQGRSFTLLVA